MLEDERTHILYRLGRIETDISKLEASDVTYAKDLAEIEKSNIRTESAIGTVLTKVKELVTDVTIMKEKPAKTYESIKIVVILFFISNTLGILWSMFIK